MGVLIVDDEETIRRTMSIALKDLGYEATAVSTGTKALSELAKGSFEVVFLDIRLNGENGMELIPKLLDINALVHIIVITAYSSIESAVEAVKRGAFDYVPKPFSPEHIGQVLSKVERTRRLEGRVAELESLLESETPAVDFESTEPVMTELFELASSAAATPATLLILGESGTGKGVLARAIHRQSREKDRPFVTVSCPSLSKELLESELFGHVRGAFTGAVRDSRGKVSLAEGGTLFLDEIGELPLEIQPKLLRLLQEREYERVGDPQVRKATVRMIATTNRDLIEEVRKGAFREDLYYRLSVFPLEVPPLRQRPGDILRLATKQLEFLSGQIGKKIRGFTPAAERMMKQYDWPGNLRELRNIIERAVILSKSDRIDVDDLPHSLGEHNRGGRGSVEIGGTASLEDLEKEHIERVLAHDISMEEAASILGIDPATLYRKRKRYGLM